MILFSSRKKYYNQVADIIIKFLKTSDIFFSSCNFLIVMMWYSIVLIKISLFEIIAGGDWRRIIVGEAAEGMPLQEVWLPQKVL